jgi:hypothetical protein
MNPQELQRVLERVASGDLPVCQAAQVLKDLPYKDVGDYARVDHLRALRRGDPEVVLGESKTAEHLVGICRELKEGGHRVLVTRLQADKAAVLGQVLPGGTYKPLSRTWLDLNGPWLDRGRGEVLVVCAGTSDLPVAEEAAVTLHALGNRVTRLTDVGVAGIHRLLGERETLERATVIVVVAGMEGALPSVVAGLTSAPVVAVPTSVGYGASFGGVAALLAMLNACASGVTVVNIDNGFGAGFAAALMNRDRARD